MLFILQNLKGDKKRKEGVKIEREKALCKKPKERHEQKKYLDSVTKVKKERCCCDDNLELFWIKRPKGCYGAKQANTIKPGDFVLVEYKGKKGSKFYTGEVL